MSDFIKTKIGFAVALLAVAFTLKPLIDPIGGSGFYAVGFMLTIMRVYFGFFVLLSIAVYCYGLLLVSERFAALLERLGNGFYTIALLIPPAFVATFGLVRIAEFVIDAIDRPLLLNIVSSFLSAISGAIVAIFTTRAYKTLTRADRASSALEAQRVEVSSISRVFELLKSGYYDLAVHECRRLIDDALKRYLIASGEAFGRSLMYNLQLAIEKGLLPQEFEPMLNKIRTIGNEAAHSVDQIDQHTANSAVAMTRIIISEISRRQLEKWMPSEYTYRKGKGSVVWHWCRNCSTWPTGEYSERDSNPTSGELCNECRRKEQDGDCS